MFCFIKFDYLNLKQILDKLNSEFTGDVRKLVFWYDANAEFKEDIETMLSVDSSLTNENMMSKVFGHFFER